MKNGFTLMELLAVIAVLAVLATLAIPNIIDSYNESIIKKMVIEENNVRDAGELYLEEHCRNPLKYVTEDVYEVYTCPTTFNNSTKKGYICLSELQHPGHGQNTGSTEESYIGEVKFKSDNCKGLVKFDGATTKTYLFCGVSESGTYPYATDNSFIPDEGMKSNCGIS